MNKPTQPAIARHPRAARETATHSTEPHPNGTHAIRYSEGGTGQSDDSGRIHAPRTVLRTILNYLVIAIIIGSVMAAILMGNSKFILLGLLIFIPYAFLLMMPVLLARATGVNKRRVDP